MSEQQRYIAQVWNMPFNRTPYVLSTAEDLEAFANNVFKVIQWINEMASQGYELSDIHETNTMSISGESTLLGSGGKTSGGTSNVFWTVIMRWAD